MRKLYASAFNKFRFLFVGLSLLLGLIPSTPLLGQSGVPITTSGTWTVPAGVTSVKVEVWGGGGGGGGAAGGAGQGGGGGAYKTSTYTVNPGDIYNITIGSGGIGGDAYESLIGGVGGTTIFSGAAGSVSAVGGQGGAYGNGGNGTGGGGNGVGDFNGGIGQPSTGNGAGGGGGAGNNGNGQDGTNSATGIGGVGTPNISPYIGGNGGAPITSEAVGNSGFAPGGGGGGALDVSFTGQKGGIGGDGYAVLTYTLPLSISGFLPTSECANTFSPVGITGVGFTDATAVTFNGTAASFTVTDDNHITATPGAGTSGTGTISVITPDGTVISTGTFTVNPVPATPTITASGPTTFCTGGSVTLNSSAGTTYLWSTGATTQSITVSTAGSYTVRVTDANECQSALSAATVVTVNPLPTANAGGALSAICQGSTSAAMGGSVSGGATGGTWSGGAGTWTNATSPANAKYTASATESGTITLTLTTSGGLCGTTTVTKPITVNQNPTANAGGAMAAICQGGTSAALGGSFAGGATSAVWSAPSGTFANNGGGTPGTATFIAASNSTSPITLTLTTSGGSCGTTTVTKSITVNQNPTANAGGALSAICQGSTSAAMGGSVSGGATGGTWSGGAGTWTNATSPANAKYTASATESGTITLTLTTSGGLCGTTTVTKPITVNQNPTANAGGAMAAICQGGTSAALGGSFGGGATSAVWSAPSGTFANNGGGTPGTATFIAASNSTSPITLTLTTSGGSCGTTTVTKSITVNQNPTANAGGALSAICQGSTSAAMGGSVSGGATGGTWSGGAGTWTNATSPANAKYTASATESGTITLTLTTSGGLCGTTTVTKPITVNQNPTANAGGAMAAICQGGTSAALGGSFAGGATSAVWSAPSGTFANNGGGTPGTATFIAASNSTSPITLTLTTSGGSCGTTTVTKSITVNQNPTANAGGALSAICQGSTSAAMGGSVSGGATGGTWSGGAGTWTNATSPANAKYTASATESGTITLTLTTSGGLCGTTTVTKPITVNKNPTANAGGVLSAICQGVTSAAMGGSVSGGATGGTWSGGAGTWTNANNPSTATYKAGAAESGTITLTLTTSGGSCGTTTVTKPITVNQNPTANAGGAMAAICQGETSAALGGSFGGGATSAVWSDGGAGGTFTNNGGSTPNITTYTSAVGSSSPVTLTLTTAGGSCGTTSANKQITVKAIPTATAGGSQSICPNGSAKVSGASSSNGTISWTENGAGSITAGGATLTPTYTAAAGDAGRTVTLTMTVSNSPCTAATATYTVIVYSLPTAGNITGTNTTVCIGSTITLTPNASGTVPLSYNWSSSNIGVATVTPPNTGAVTGAGVGTTNITYTVTDGNGCTSVKSANYPVTVTKPTANAITQASGLSSVCMNSTLQLTSNATSVTGAPIYSWSSSNTAVATVDNNGLVTGVTTGTTNITYTVTDGNGCVSAISPNYAITVIAIPTGTFTATENSGITPNDNIICAGDNVTFSAPPGYSSYTFYVNGVVAQSASANNLFNTSSLNNGEQVTVNVANTSNCGATFGPITITVNTPPTPTLSADKSTICQGDLVTFTAGGGGASSVYTFELNGSPVQSGASSTYTNSTLNNNDKVTVILTDANKCAATYATPIVITVNGLPSGTLTPNPNPAKVCAGSNITFTATPGFSSYEFFVSGVSQGVIGTNTFSSTTLTNGSVVTVKATNTNTCSNTFNPVPVTINALPTGSLAVTEISGTANDNIICAGAPVTFTVTPSGSGTYAFYLNGTGAALQTGSSNKYISTTLANGDYITVVVSNASGCQITLASSPITVIQPPTGSLTALPSGPVCAGSSVTFTADAGYSNYNFKIGGTSVQIGTGNTFTSTTLANGNVVTVDVSNSNGCITTFGPITMQVNALPTGNLAFAETSGLTNNDGIICAGAPVVFTATSGFSNYNFLLNGASIQNGSSNIYTTSTLNNSDIVTVTVTNGSGCIALFNSYTITVNPLPTVAAITGIMNVCVNSTTALLDATSGGTWSSSDPTTASVDAGTGVVSGVKAGTVTIVYTTAGDASGCTNSVSTIVTVKPLPVVATIGGLSDVCVNSTIPLTDATSGGTWSTGDGTIAIVDGSGNVTGKANGTVTISYSVTNGNGCSTTVNKTINVHALPVVPPIAGTFSVCVNAATTLADASGGGLWSSGNTGIATVNATTGVVTGISAGTATISYTYTDGNTCSSTITQDVTVNALPVPTLLGPNPICLGSTDNVYTTENAVGIHNYLWNVVNGSVTAGGTSTDNTVTISWLTPGAKSISVNYTDANGCVGATSATVVNAPGTSPTVSGVQTVCQGSTGITYTAPSGEIDYSWTISSGGTITAGGTSTDPTVTVTWNGSGAQSVTINYADLGGCSAATPTVWPVTVNPLPTLVINNPAAVCAPSTVDLTAVAVTAGSTSGLTYTYYTDAGGTTTLASPNAVATSGTYYIKGTTAAGCSDVIKPVTVTINPLPTLIINNPAQVCAPSTVDLTAAAVTAGSTSGLTFTYYTDAAGTTTLASPNAVTTSGTYYIKGTTAQGCSDVIKPVTVTVNPLPTLVINNPAAVCAPATVDLTAAAVTSGSTPSLTYTYYTDAAGTTTLASPNAVASSATYFIKGTTTEGCSDVIKPVIVTINPLPTLIINNPAQVCAPSTIDLTAAAVTAGSTSGLTYTYYTDAAGTTTLASPNAVTTSGTYFIKGTTAQGCSDAIKPVTVIINPLPTLVINNPVAVCAPSTVDLTAAAVTAGSTSGLTYTYYTDAAGTTTLASPNAVATSGTYYIKGTTAPGCSAAIQPVVVTVTPAPTAIAGTPVSTCANSGAVNITAGSGATNQSSVLWTSSGTGTFINANSLTTASYTPGAADITAGSVTLTLTANGNGSCAAVTSTKTLTISTIPTISVVPVTATICQGSIQALTATSTGSPVPQTPQTFSSGPINVTIPDATRGGNGEVNRSITVVGIPAVAVITNITVVLNASNVTRDGDLNFNIKAPNGNRLNLVNIRGGNSNKGFTNTAITWNGGVSLSTGSAPFTGTFSPDATTGLGPSGNTSNATSFSQLTSSPNGAWTLYAEDVTNNSSTGTINSWSVTIDYTIPVSNPVTWSPVTDLYTDAGATIPYAGESLTTVYAEPASSGTVVYTATATNASGCTNTAQTTLTVTPTPVISISADYCIVPGKVLLTASSVPAATTYVWNTGGTKDTIQVNVANNYSVTVSAGGCPSTGNITVAQNLVVNGDFSQGNVGFTSDYAYHADPVLTCGFIGCGGTPANGVLYDDSGNNGYSIGPSGQDVHTNFWGYDHTTESGISPKGNYMIINGHGNTLVIWKETVNVLPNTTYYFSAWAMSVNNAGNNAQLQFSVNGTLTGTTAVLANHCEGCAGGKANDNWTQFYGNWTSGPTTTTAVIYINDLQGALSGNDFGLDDINFGTLSPFIFLVSAPGTDAQTPCVNTPITPIVYSVGSTSAGPTISSPLPAGLTGTFAPGSGLYTITGTPTVAGNYTYTLTTTGTCNPTSATGTINIQSQTITLSSGNANPVQCKTAPVNIGFTLGGTSNDATATGLPVGVTGNTAGNTYTVSGTPTDTAGIYHYSIITKGTGCNADTLTGTITLQQQSITHNSGDSLQTVCINTPIDNIQYTISGPGSLNGTVTGLPGGVSYTYNSGILIISGTPNAAGTFTYYITGSGGCANAKDSGVITVTPAATLTLTSGEGTDDQTECINSAITNITYLLNNATNATVDGLPDGITGSAAGGIFTITGTSSEAGIFTYTITTTDGCGTGTATGTITVQSQTIALTTGNKSPTLCQNTAMTPIVFTIGGTATGATLSGQPTGVNGVLSGNTFTLSGTPSVSGTFQYIVTVTGSCATPVADTGIITVTQAAIGGNIQLVSTYVCDGGTAIMTLMNQVGTILGWQSSVDGGATWSALNGNTTISETASGVLVPTLWRVQISNGCGITNSSTATVGIHNYWTGGTSIDWNTASNWSDNLVPSTSCADVYIPGGTLFQPTLSTGTATITNLHIYVGGILTVTGATLQIGGTISNAGTFIASNGTIELNGTSAQTVPAATFQNNAVKDLVISNAAGVTLGGEVDVYESLTYGIASGILNTGGFLTLKSSAAQTAWIGNMTGETISGNVTVERYIDVGKGHGASWQFVATPTQGQTVKESWMEGGSTPVGYGTQVTDPSGTANGFDVVTPQPSLKYYNYVTDGWVGIGNTAIPVYNPEGYMLFVRGDRSVSYPSVGNTTLRTKGMLLTPSNPPPSTLVNGNHFASIGNPYASAVYMSKVSLGTAGVSDFFYVWDPTLSGAYGVGGYRTLSNDGTGLYIPTPSGGSGDYVSGTRTIESGQAFFMQAAGVANGTVSFDESMKASGSNLVFRGAGTSATTAGPSTELRANLYGVAASTSFLADGNLIEYNTIYSDKVDGYDAKKLVNSSENFGIISGGKNLVIERRTDIQQTDTIFYNLTGVRAQNYRIVFTANGLSAYGLQGFIEDSYLKTRKPLNMEGTTEADFAVTSVAGSYAANRFRIVFAPQPPTEVALTFISLTARQQDGDIAVNWKVNNEKGMKQYEVEKSMDGVNFTKVATVSALNSGIGSYQWIDTQVTPGDNYYRIRCVAMDGSISYSTVVKVTVVYENPSIAIYPNPITDGIIHLQFVNQPQGRYGIRLLNSLGQLISAKQIEHPGGDATENIQWNYYLSHGVYQLEVIKPDGSMKIIKVLY